MSEDLAPLASFLCCTHRTCTGCVVELMRHRVPDEVTFSCPVCRATCGLSGMTVSHVVSDAVDGFAYVPCDEGSRIRLWNDAVARVLEAAKTSVGELHARRRVIFPVP